MSFVRCMIKAGTLFELRISMMFTSVLLLVSTMARLGLATELYRHWRP